MLIYGLKNCDTCRKAIKALPDAQLVDVRKDGVPADVLARLPRTSMAFDVPLEFVFRAVGVPYHP